MRLDGQPYLQEFRRCGETGCDHCGLVQDAVSCMLPGLRSPEKVEVFGFVLGEDGGEWLRIGLVNEDADDVYRIPREWVDLRWATDESKLILVPGPLLSLTQRGFLANPYNGYRVRACVDMMLTLWLCG